MITLKTETTIGTVEISGGTAAEVHGQLQQLMGSRDLAALWGRVKSELEGEATSMEAQANVGNILGGQEIEGSQEYTFEGGITINGQPAKQYKGINDQGQEVRALWWGENGNLPITDNPAHPGLEQGTHRFWKWF